MQTAGLCWRHGWELLDEGLRWWGRGKVLSLQLLHSPSTMPWPLPGLGHQWPFLFIFLFTSSWSYPPLEVVVKFGCFCANCLAVWKKLSLESYVRGREKEGSKGLSCFSHQYKSVERETMNIFIYYLYGAINVLGTLQSNKRQWPCCQNLAAWEIRAGLLQLNDQGWITDGEGMGVWVLQD